MWRFKIQKNNKKNTIRVKMKKRSQIFLERSIYSQNKTVTLSADIDIKYWFIFYKKLLNKGDNEPFHKGNLMIRWEDIELDKEITLDEINAKIKSLAYRKAEGPDNRMKAFIVLVTLAVLVAVVTAEYDKPKTHYSNITKRQQTLIIESIISRKHNSINRRIDIPEIYNIIFPEPFRKLPNEDIASK
ncbi:hypothetical protein LAZ67_3002867 [Cordylochernes scorpioides]|uniref:Uncharacterized protein n=1 Tax=Cordylochernes scorpioides TaxID=51811 RepID=A0ABY6K8A5_9ARAC|nr:hypothetical protein LAZ67_3002867 [Cordylochernes scorpioides]